MAEPSGHGQRSGLWDFRNERAEDMVVGLTLRDNAKATLGVALHSLIHIRVLARHNEEQDLRHKLSLVTSLGTAVSNSDRQVLALLLHVNNWVAVVNSATMANVGLDEDAKEVANNSLRKTTIKDSNTP